jgi:tocopherol O-methyltransferase
MSANIYDDLDPLYREIWGLSLHHGCWETGNETVSEAKKNLTTKVIDLLQPDGCIADIGCGYGVLAHQLISRFDCMVTACTSSQAQAGKIPCHPDLTLLQGDWLAQDLAPGSLDQAVAIESLSHFEDLDAFFRHTSTALKPGSRLVIADWFSNCGSGPLLRHLAKVGELPGWHSLDTLLRSAAKHGLVLTNQENLSLKVARTWSAIFLKSAILPFRCPKVIPMILLHLFRKPALLWAFPFLRLAYHLGELEYHLSSFTKVVSLSSRPSP